jgi:hypothetical protein
MHTSIRLFLMLTAAMVITACEQPTIHEEIVVVPAGTYFLKPNITDNECTSRDLAFIERTPDRLDPSGAIMEPISFMTYEGIVHTVISCPSGNAEDEVEQVALIELNDGRLVWVDKRKVLHDPH